MSEKNKTTGNVDMTQQSESETASKETPHSDTIKESSKMQMPEINFATFIENCPAIIFINPDPVF